MPAASINGIHQVCPGQHPIPSFCCLRYTPHWQAALLRSRHDTVALLHLLFCPFKLVAQRSQPALLCVQPT